MDISERTFLSNRILRKIIICVFSFFIVPIQAQASQVEFLQQDVLSDSILFEIKLARLRRQVNRLKSSSVTDDISNGLREAMELAHQREYDLAAAYVDHVETLLEETIEIEEPILSPEPDLSGIQWNVQALTGVEFWQQRFGITLSDHDSLLQESENNPFIGVRMLMNAEDGVRISSDAELELKQSREYTSGVLTMTHQRQVHPVIRMFVDNSFEVTSYHRYTDLRYIDNRFDAGSIFRLGSSEGKVNYRLDLRRYENESDFFSNYVQHGAGLKWSIAALSTEFEYELLSRRYTTYSQRSYREYDAGLVFFPRPAGSLSAYGRLSGRRRLYDEGYADSLFTNDFSEFYCQTALRANLSKRLVLRLDGEAEWRRYEVESLSMPDFIDWNIEPTVTFGVMQFWSVKGGFRFREKSHRLGGIENQEAVQTENFFSYGPVLAIDFFSAFGLIASIGNTYEIRRFPHAPHSDGIGLPMYSDRNINALFLFITWNFSKHWELEIFGSFDYERDRDLQGGDSRSNLFNFELSYKF